MKLKLRAIAAFLALSFSIEQFSYAAGDVIKPVIPALFKEDKLKLGFDLPESIASVEDSWKAPKAESGERRVESGENQTNLQQPATFHSPLSNTLIYLLQDAHTNNSGQINLAKTLDLILKHESGKWKVEIRNLPTHSPLSSFPVFLEAGVGNNSLSFLRESSSHQLRKQVSDSYLKKGLLHGAEYLDLTSTHAFTLWGVEDMEFYFKALHNYQYVAKNRDKFKDYLKRINQTLNTLKPRIYNPVLLSFEEKQSKYLKEELSLTDYFDVLTQYTSIIASPIGAKQSYPSHQIASATLWPRNDTLSRYPHLKALKNLKEKEEQIDFKAANQEQIEAVQSLSPQDQQELLELSGKEKSPFKLTSQDHKELKGFYALLEEKLTQRVIARNAVTKQSKLIAEIVRHKAMADSSVTHLDGLAGVRHKASANPSLTPWDESADALWRTLWRASPPQSAADRNDTLYPNLFKYFSYLKESKSLNPQAILEELKALEEETLDSLSTTEDEKTLLKCQKTLRLLQKLFSLTLTPEEYEEYKAITKRESGEWRVESGK